jgi:hypothetical protein
MVVRLRSDPEERPPPLVDLVGGSLVRITWYHGWGIKLMGNGRLYTIAGFRGVECGRAV